VADDGKVRQARPASRDVLVRLLEAVDAALDGLLRERRTRMTRARFDAHMRLALDTFQRLLRSDPPRVAGR